MSTAVETDLESHLPRFGLSSFRPGQQEVISAVLAGQDCLCVMPTGGGKSLCYQLPAVVRDGVTLVISPLIALMKDQVDALASLGLRATFINSTLTSAEQQQRLAQMAAGEYDLVYVVPERFRSPRFLEAARASQLQLLAVDEAHCVSEWGHDFRPDYARLGRFRHQIGDPPTIALTATATDAVRRDVIELLGLRSPKTVITGFERPNLRYEVTANLAQREKDDRLLAFLRETPGSGIVYASTRKRCEEVAEMISTRTRRPAGVYHAGMAPDERRAAQDEFMAGSVEIIVATNAFGMGIDKADVRFVVHYNMPGTVEAYYQEAGRAGRDGLPARCFLMYGAADRNVQEFFIESAYPSSAVLAGVYDFLCASPDDPIELTQEEIKKQLGLDVGSEAVGQCERLLEKAGALHRLDPCENMAVVSIKSDLPTVVDLLPRQAKVRRKVLQAIEKLVGSRRHEMVYFNRRELLEAAEVDASTLTRTLAELRELEAFDYVPPFRGRAVHMVRRDVPLEQLDIDFELLAQRKAAEYGKLDAMCRLAESTACRQQLILHYFGERPGPPCDNCDNCTQPRRAHSEVRAVAAGEDPVYEAVRKVISGVARAGGRFGRNLIAQMLCGSKAENVTRFRLDKLSTYGVLQPLKQDEVVAIIDGLIAADCLQKVQVEAGRPVIQLTEVGEEVMRGRRGLEAGLTLPRDLFRKLGGADRRPAGQRSGADGASVADLADISDEPDGQLLDALKEWRRETATAEKVAAYRVLSNATLEELARQRPTAVEALLQIKGIGPAKLEHYGEAILGLTRDGGTGTAVDSAAPPVASETAAPSGTPVAPRSRSDSPDTSRASHYWSWLLLSKGLHPEECAAIRGLKTEEILDHALRAAEEGFEVEPEWLLDPEQIAAMEAVIGGETPRQIRPLLAQLPPGTRYEHVQWFLKCRRQ